MNPRSLESSLTLQDIQADPAESPLSGGWWFIGESESQKLVYSIEPGTLAATDWLSADMLLDGEELAVFQLSLRERDQGDAARPPREFHLIFGLLNQCSARLRLDLTDLNQNRWSLPREGACLKRHCGGDRVEAERVDRITLSVTRRGDRAARWCMTPLMISDQEPAWMGALVLPKGKLIDELGQWAIRDWTGKTGSSAAVTRRLRSQRRDAEAARLPEGFSRWGGSTRAAKLEPGKCFRTHHDGQRWWLVDPDGHLFFSAGLDCVRPGIPANHGNLKEAVTWLPARKGPYAAIYSGQRSTEAVDYLRANLIRAFGADWHAQWGAIALGEMRRLGFNTVANWSDWQIAKAGGFPYVRPLDARLKRTPEVYRDFVDVFDPAFEPDCRDFAQQLLETRDDPAMIGYFLMNEPKWGFAIESPAAGMLFTTETCHARANLAEHLKTKYGDSAGLTKAWGMDTTLEAIGRGKWSKPLSAAAKSDLEAFSTVMIERLFHILSAACRAVDPDHLNLGARYYTLPPEWALAGMTCFDVFSINSYTDRAPKDKIDRIVELMHRPVMIGEWHFGALDVGLPASGIGRVKDQAARGQAYRVYFEGAAAHPGCVGVHYFTMYDQSALGRFDGENYNIGLYDICHRPYEPLSEAAGESHKAMYAVRSGQQPPYDRAPKYLSKLF